MSWSVLAAMVALAAVAGCRGPESPFVWDVVLSPPRVDPPSFQCVADGWAVGPPQVCPRGGCAKRPALVAICRGRFADAAAERARARERTTIPPAGEGTPPAVR